MHRSWIRVWIRVGRGLWSGFSAALRAQSIVALGLALGGSPAWAQQQSFENVEVRPIPVADGLYMLVGQGGNIGLSVGSDGAFLIDDQFAPLTDKIRAAVESLSSEPIRFVFNTHWHGDHTGGNENLGEGGALIVAHENVRRRMSTEQIRALRNNERVPASPPVALPVVTFNDSVTFHWNGTEIHAFHMAPAHTDGDSIVHFPALDAIHMGDTFFNGFYPFIDLDSGGSVDGMIAAANRGLELATETTRIIPGHGPLARRTDLVAFRDMLKGIRDGVSQLAKEGKSLDEIVAAKPSAKYDAEWGDGFLQPDVFVRLVYASLTRR